MAPLELEGDTLVKKHQYYNKLVEETLKTNRLEELVQGDDIPNLLNIDIACKSRNVDYILDVLRSEDELYFSKAIKRSTWLCTDPQYAYIINPEYLYTELYNEMTFKAFNKLMLNVRLHLKDETRVEAFYNYIKEKDKQLSYKWLQHCSIPFVEIEVVKHYRDIPEYIALRLVKKSFSIFEIYIKKWKWILPQCLFLLKNHSVQFLDIFEILNTTNSVIHFNFSAVHTEILMKNCPKRIINNFEFYSDYLDIATFAKYLNKEENIQDFLLKYANNTKFQWLYEYNNIQYFIKLLPRESRFEFVKKVFIDMKTFVPGEAFKDASADTMYSLNASSTPQNIEMYQWYKFAQFEVAYTDLKKIISGESDPVHRNLIFKVLLCCAGRNMQHIQTVLQYYYDRHINEDFKYKIKFVNFFIAKVVTHNLDERTWDILNKLFHSLGVFIESENNVQSCIKAIIVRNAIRNKEVPGIIKKKFVFDTLKSYQFKLSNQEEKDAVFKYLYDYITTKSNSQNLTDISKFDNAVNICEQLFNLIKDWGKELNDYPYALEKVKQLIKSKLENNWNRDLSALYNFKKSWRKVMFEESIAISPSEEVCMNALKHDPGLLSRNKEQVMLMFFNDNVSLRKLFKKLRIFWPHTLADEWRKAYLKHLELPGGHKATVLGLCTLLPPEEIENLLRNYAPSESKIDVVETDQHMLSLRKQIAKSVHIARPQPSVEGILLYAKGDYLQYAVPSINAVISQMSPNKCRGCISLFLSSPVSLQKFGVRFAFKKLTYEELIPMLSEIWNFSKTSSIRAVLFTHTFQLLCKQKNSSRINEIWNLLRSFIDKLSPNESNLIYKQLGNVSDVPDSIKPQFYKKIYTLIKSLPAKCNCESILIDMQLKAKGFMEFLDNDFVVNVMLKKFFEKFIEEECINDDAAVISTFILASKNEQNQIRRYEMSLAKLLDEYLHYWDKIDKGEYRVKRHIKIILESLAVNLSHAFEKKMNIPLKVFEAIQMTLEKSLRYEKDYVLLTAWKLMVAFVKILDETNLVTVYYKMEADYKIVTDDEKDKIYTEIHKKLAPFFTKTCIQYIKEDVDRFGSSIVTLFSKALGKFFNCYLTRSVCKCEYQIEYLLHFLKNHNDREVWLIVHNVFEKETNYIYYDKERMKFEEVREFVYSHPSDEVNKVLYYDLFDNVVPFTSTSNS